VWFFVTMDNYGIDGKAAIWNYSMIYRMIKIILIESRK
jgi:hypothetical protein